MIHSPELSEKNHKAIEAATGLKFDDISYKNDACDSIEAQLKDGRFMQVFLPNCEEVTEEENGNAEDFTTFAIRLYDADKAEELTSEGMTNAVYNLSEVIEEIKRLNTLQPVTVEEVTERLQQSIDSLTRDLLQGTSGDITPLQTEKLDQAVKQIANILTEVVNQNR